MKKQEILQLALKVGVKILESGGETYRVEETINRILLNYGIERGESFVTPTGIVISGLDEENKSISIVKRITSLKIDLEKISMINDLSRRAIANNLTPLELSYQFDEIESRKRYPYWLDLLCASMVGFSFSIIFGGNITEALTSAFISPLLIVFIGIIRDLGLSSFFQNAFGGMFIVLLAQLFSILGLYPTVHNVVVGAIMLLVPGIAITNAIRDTFRGDYLSGVVRATEALVTASGIAFGTALAFIIVRI